MGLDMYLKAKTFVHGFANDREQYDKVIDAINAKAIASDDHPTAEISVGCAYWRKANAIHGWFVREVQNGEDECREHWVPREKLEELVETCVRVMSDNSLAPTLLPPTDGFFFGGTDLDEWYWGYIKETAEVIGTLLKKIPAEANWDFYYRSSW